MSIQDVTFTTNTGTTWVVKNECVTRFSEAPIPNSPHIILMDEPLVSLTPSIPVEGQRVAVVTVKHGLFTTGAVKVVR